MDLIEYENTIEAVRITARICVMFCKHEKPMNDLQTKLTKT